MVIRVQPKEVVVSPKDPFDNDKLNRKDSILALTNVLGQIEGPCVMAVDAGWGKGKTTYLRMWAQHLRDEEFPVVEFNAWETDYAGQPFVALTSEISVGLRQRLDGPDNSRLERLVESTGHVLNGLSAPAVRLAASAVPLVGKQLVQELDGDPSTLAEAMAATYGSMKGAMTEFRVHLEKAAAGVVAITGGHPLVVFIDELDRCRPTYAIELLETAKHFFNVDHVVFVLCLDRVQLAHSVKAVYGNDFAADGYLRRFFDIDYRLPEPRRAKFLTVTGDELQIPEEIGLMASNGQLRSQIGDPGSFQGISHILEASPLSLRDLQQTLTRLMLLLSSVPNDQYLNVDTLVVLLVLRMLDSELYQQVLAGNASDEEAIAAFRLRKSDSSDTQVTVRTTIESVLSASVCIASSNASNQLNEDMTPLLLHYRRAMDSTDSEPNQRDNEQLVASLVVQYVSAFCGRRPLSQQEWDFNQVRDRCGFYSAIRYLELFQTRNTQHEKGGYPTPAATADPATPASDPAPDSTGPRSGPDAPSPARRPAPQPLPAPRCNLSVTGNSPRRQPHDWRPLTRDSVPQQKSDSLRRQPPAYPPNESSNSNFNSKVLALGKYGGGSLVGLTEQ